MIKIGIEQQTEDGTVLIDNGSAFFFFVLSSYVTSVLPAMEHVTVCIIERAYLLIVQLMLQCIFYRYK